MDPIKRAKDEVLLYAREHLCPTDHVKLDVDDVYVVWFCYILGGWKALVSTSLPDGMYYEVTFNKDADVIYVDAYKKFDHKISEH